MTEYHNDYNDYEENEEDSLVPYHEKEPNTNDDDLLGTIIGIGAGVLFGLVGAAILDSILGYRCPYCNYKIPKNTTLCPQCNNYLRWD